MFGSTLCSSILLSIKTLCLILHGKESLCSSNIRHFIVYLQLQLCNLRSTKLTISAVSDRSDLQNALHGVLMTLMKRKISHGVYQYNMMIAMLHSAMHKYQISTHSILAAIIFHQIWVIFLYIEKILANLIERRQTIDLAMHKSNIETVMYYKCQLIRFAGEPSNNSHNMEL